MWLWIGGALAADAPFTWTVRVDGKETAAKDGAVVVASPGWTCWAVVDPVEREDGAVTQFGGVRCTGPKAAGVEITVLCQTDANTHIGRGAGALILSSGARVVALEMVCRSTGDKEGPRLRLEPDAGGGIGIPKVRQPAPSGQYRWQLVGPAKRRIEPVGGPFDAEVPGWTCATEVSGVTDPTYGASQYATLDCAHEDTRATTIVAWTQAAAHACQAGGLRISRGEGSRAAWILVCEDVGNPGCF